MCKNSHPERGRERERGVCVWGGGGGGGEGGPSVATNSLIYTNLQATIARFQIAEAECISPL